MLDETAHAEKQAQEEAGYEYFLINGLPVPQKRLFFVGIAPSNYGPLTFCDITILHCLSIIDKKSNDIFIMNLIVLIIFSFLFE